MLGALMLIVCGYSLALLIVLLLFKMFDDE